MVDTPRSRKLFWSAVGAGVIAVTVIALAWRHDSARGMSEPPQNRPIMALEGNYVTSNSCRACHPGNYASWHASFHRTMKRQDWKARPRPALAGLRYGSSSLVATTVM